MGVAFAAAFVDARAAADESPSVIVESFTAGGHEQTIALQPAGGAARGATDARFRSYGPVRLPVSAQALDFRIGPNPAGTEQPARIQFQLEGRDENWREAEGVMWLTVRFIDEQGRGISSAALPRAGRSSGWTGDPRTSPFRSATETVVPPALTRHVQVYFAAGGGPRTMGTWLVKAIRVIAVPGGQQPEKVLLDDRIETGDNLNDPRGVPVGWRREGTNTSIPQVFSLGRPGGPHALALIDNDVRTTARWVGSDKNIVSVEPGVPLRIETEEAFSIGASGSYTSSYYKLPAGRYTFRAIPVDEFGVQVGLGVALPLTLVPPVYATVWFWAIAALVVVAGVAGVVRYATRRRMQRELELSERHRAIEAERMRIAQDIHDDMGARLTQISLASALALRNAPPGSPVHADVKRVERAAREMAIALDEIVWAVNPAHDTLEGLGNYVSQYVTEITAESSTRCRLEIPALLPARFIPSGVRHHLLMALKEALNNALKHGGASETRVRLTFVEPTLTLTVADDGKGFDPAVVPSGNGIANMTRRLVAAGGTCEIRSTPGRGTTVTCILNLATTSPAPGPRPAGQPLRFP